MPRSPAGLDGPEKSQYPIGSSGVLFHDRACTPAELGGLIWVSQEFSDGRRQFSRTLNLHRRLRFEEQSSHVPKIFHVRSEDNRLVVPRRFEHIVPTLRY